MAKIIIALEEELITWLRTQVTKGDFESIEQIITYLIKREMVKENLEKNPNAAIALVHKNDEALRCVKERIGGLMLGNAKSKVEGSRLAEIVEGLCQEIKTYKKEVKTNS